jgi:hypothetical protein
MERFSELHGEARFVVRRVEQLLEGGMPEIPSEE